MNKDLVIAGSAAAVGGFATCFFYPGIPVHNGATVTDTGFLNLLMTDEHWETDFFFFLTTGDPAQVTIPYYIGISFLVGLIGVLMVLYGYFQ